MKVLKMSLWIVLIASGLFGLFLLFSTLNDYRPGPESGVFSSSSPDPVPDSTTLTLVTWNIGYCGLDASMDFFYDGGEQVRPEKKAVKENLAGIKKELEAFGGYDFILLQEVDQASKRSYRINEYDSIARQFASYHSVFGMNYRVWFVPVPLKSPMGAVRSGLQTLSSRTPAQVTRYSFPGNYSWPTRLYMLDRCFLVNRYPVEGGKELLVINTHNSAYDDGTLRKGQMAYLRSFLLDEYAKGNYVIAGGDWNQSPAGFEPLFDPALFDRNDLTYIENGYPDPDWIWAFDASVPTNRRVITPYDPDSTPVTVIDQYLLSPNIAVEEVRGIPNGFRYSDHQPVILKVKLN